MNEEKIVIYRANGQITTIHVYTPEELGRDRFDSIEQRNAEYNESPNNKKEGFTSEIITDPKVIDIIHYFKERPVFDKDDLLEAVGQISELADYIENGLEVIKEK